MKFQFFREYLFLLFQTINKKISNIFDIKYNKHHEMNVKFQKHFPQKCLERFHLNSTAQMWFNRFSRPGYTVNPFL